MLITASVVAFIFRIINFGALVGLTIFLAKKYLMPTLNNAMYEHESAIEQIEQHTQDLQSHAQQLDEQFKKQEHLTNELIRKIHAWKSQFEAQKVKREQLHQELIESAHKKIATQQQMIKQMYVQNKVLPIAIDHAQKTLEQQFSSEDTGVNYIADVILGMKRAEK